MAKQPLRRSRWRKRIVYLIGAIGLYLLLCLVLAYRYVHPSGSRPVKPPNAEAMQVAGPYGEVPVWCTPGLAKGEPESKTVFILCHGYGGSRESWAQTLEDLEAKGYEVVAPEMPGHGESTDRTVGFGRKESEILIATAKWARSRYGLEAGAKAAGTPAELKFIAVGVSMGGAACWLASEKEPDLFAAIVSEGAFARLDEAADRWFDMLLPGGHVVLAPVRWFSESMSGVKTASVNPIDAAKKWTGKPALVIHCGSDGLMDVSHAKRLAEASGAEYWEIADSHHACGYSDAQPEYLARLMKLAGPP